MCPSPNLLDTLVNSGSGRKPWKQKGTGRARAGHTRAPQWRKGAKAHGPVIRDYSFDLNKKCALANIKKSSILNLAVDRAFGMMIALAAKLREGNLIVVDALEPQVFR
jgi:large subunit ribosomal protein L4